MQRVYIPQCNECLLQEEREEDCDERYESGVS